jgi:hypothetical protein
MTSTGNGDHIDRDMIGRIVVTKMESKDRGFAVCGSDRGRRVVPRTSAPSAERPDPCRTFRIANCYCCCSAEERFTG